MRTSGLGSLPGTDVAAGIRFALSDVDLPWLPEFPARGPWAGLIGRSLGMVDGLGASLLAGQWQLSDVAGIDQRRARTTLRDDLDICQENADGFTGTLRLTTAGPWTLAAATLLPRGGRVLGDRVARRDLAQALAAGVTQARTELARRLPGVSVSLQVDEPSLPAVLAGTVPTEGGYFRHRAVGVEEAVTLLRELDGEVLHCCASGLDVGLAIGEHGAGFEAVSLDAALIRPADWERLGPLLENGKQLWLGLADATTGVAPTADRLTADVLALLRPLELGPMLREAIVLTPSCGLPNWPIGQVPRLFGALRTAAGRLDEELVR